MRKPIPKPKEKISPLQSANPFGKQMSFSWSFWAYFGKEEYLTEFGHFYWKVLSLI